MPTIKFNHRFPKKRFGERRLIFNQEAGVEGAGGRNETEAQNPEENPSLLERGLQWGKDTLGQAVDQLGEATKATHEALVQESDKVTIKRLKQISPDELQTLDMRKKVDENGKLTGKKRGYQKGGHKKWGPELTQRCKALRLPLHSPKEWQEFLNRNGAKPQLNVDEKWGPKSNRCLVKFLKQLGTTQATDQKEEDKTKPKEEEKQEAKEEGLLDRAWDFLGFGEDEEKKDENQEEKAPEFTHDFNQDQVDLISTLFSNSKRPEVETGNEKEFKKMLSEIDEAYKEAIEDYERGRTEQKPSLKKVTEQYIEDLTDKEVKQEAEKVEAEKEVQVLDTDLSKERLAELKKEGKEAVSFSEEEAKAIRTVFGREPTNDEWKAMRYRVYNLEEDKNINLRKLAEEQMEEVKEKTAKEKGHAFNSGEIVMINQLFAEKSLGRPKENKEDRTKDDYTKLWKIKQRLENEREKEDRKPITIKDAVDEFEKVRALEQKEAEALEKAKKKFSDSEQGKIETYFEEKKLGKIKAHDYDHLDKIRDFMRDKPGGETDIKKILLELEWFKKVQKNVDENIPLEFYLKHYEAIDDAHPGGDDIEPQFIYNEFEKAWKEEKGKEK